MRKLLGLLLLYFYAVLGLFVMGVSAQTPAITSDSVPPSITAGGTHQFTADQAVTWSVTGGGTIDKHGLYHAPAVVRPKNQSRGCQLLPNNNAYNTRVDGLPVHPRSAQWLQRPIDFGPPTSYFYHTLNPGAKAPGFGFFDNVVDNSTPLQTMKEYYIDLFNGVQMPMPFDASKHAQAGWDYPTDDGRDHHMFRINKDTCVDYEQYQRYQDFSNPVFTPGNPTKVAYATSQLAPSATPMLVGVAGGTGCWAAANGTWQAQVIDRTHIALPVDTSACGAPSPVPFLCPHAGLHCGAKTQNINTQGADVFFPDSNTVVWGADAGRSPISATSLHSQEWYDAVQKCIAAGDCATADVKHALRTTLDNRDLASYFVWPAVGWAGGMGSGYNASAGHWDAASGTTIFTINGNISWVRPCPGWVSTPGCHFQILFVQQNANSSYSGTLTGSWTGLNSSGPFDAAAIQATVVDNTHFSVAVNSSKWGAQTPAFAHLYYDFIPDGAHFRLQSSFSNASVCTTESWCPYAQVYLNTLKHYGFVLLDGTFASDNWDMGTVNSEFNNQKMALAFINLRLYFNNLSHPFDRLIEVVDNRSLRVNPGDQHDLTTSIDRVTVTATNTNGSKSVDILPLGTTVGVFPELISIATGSTYQFHPWVNNNENNDVTYSMPNDIPGLSISSSGLLTAPPLGTMYTLIPSTILTITSHADPSAHVYVTVEVIPTSPDGKIRVLGAGNYVRPGVWVPTYTDSSGFLWVGGTQTHPGIENWRMPMTDNGVILSTSAKIPAWVGPKPDGNLYWNVYQTGFDDVVSRLVVPNGTYKVTLYGSPNWKAAQLGVAAYDWELQGITVASRVDPYAQSGLSLNQGYTLTGLAMVTDGMLVSGIRNRVYSGANPYGALLGAIKIEPASGNLTVAQTGSLPVGTNQIAYNAVLQAYGGTAPYRFSLVAGSLPPGVTLASNGTLSGIPLAGGAYNFQLSVTDSPVYPATAITNMTLKIVVP